MRIILTVNLHCQGFKMEAVRFLCISLGFVQLADQTRVHFRSPWEEDVERHAEQQRAFRDYKRKFVSSTRIGGNSNSSIVRIHF